MKQRTGSVGLGVCVALLGFLLAALALVVRIDERHQEREHRRLQSKLETLETRQKDLADLESVADLREAVESLQTQVTSLDQLVTRLLEATPPEDRQAALLRWMQREASLVPGTVAVAPGVYHRPWAASTRPDASAAERIVHGDMLALAERDRVDVAAREGQETHWYFLERE